MGSNVYIYLSLYMIFFIKIGLEVQVIALEAFPFLHYFRNCKIKILVSIHFIDLAADSYWDNTWMYVDEVWAWWNILWNIFGLTDSNTNLFDLFEDLFEILTFKNFLTSLLYIHNSVLENR